MSTWNPLAFEAQCSSQGQASPCPLRGLTAVMKMREVVDLASGQPQASQGQQLGVQTLSEC